MSAMAEATIVIPLLSQPDSWLDQCVRSALEQSAPTAVIVVSAAVTPTSNQVLLRRLASENPRLRWFEQKPGGGFAAAINEGWEQAMTPRVGLLLSDDWLNRDAVEHCLVFDADIVSSGDMGHAEDGTVLWRSTHRQDVFDALPTLEAKACYLNHFYLFRRESVLAVGGVDPAIGNVGPDDYDLPWTLLENGADAVLVDRPLYHYRDHERQRLTLRPQQDQERDLRRILAKHGVDPIETERLVEEKTKWYGAPVHVAMRNPDWYRVQGSGIDRKSLGDELFDLVATVEVPLRCTQAVAGRYARADGKASFRLEFEDNRVLKGRYLDSAKQAEKLERLASILKAVPMSRVLARKGRVVLEEWIDGTPLDQCVEAGVPITPEQIEHAGALLGRLAVEGEKHPEIDCSPYSPDGKLETLNRHLATLTDVGLLGVDTAAQLRAAAHENAPFQMATGLVHLDLQPRNLVVTDNGLALIDNESLAVGSLDFDLARTWYLWNLNRAGRNRFLRGYSGYRDPIGFIRHELFWAIVTLVAGAELEHRVGNPTERVVAALHAIAGGELPQPWRRDAEQRAHRNERIRVGFVCDYLAVGGQERALLNLLRGFDSERFARFVYAFRGGEMVREVEALGIPLTLGSARQPLSWADGWTEVDAREVQQFRRALADALRRDRIDALIVLAWPDAVAAAREAGVQVLIERTDGPALLDKIADKSAFDRVMCQSASTRDELLARSDELALDDMRLELVYPGIDLKRFDPAIYDKRIERERLGLAADDLVVGYVGRLDPDKRVDHLMCAVSFIEQPIDGRAVKFLIMGPDAGALAELQELRGRLDLGDRVLFIAAGPRVAPTLATLDLFALMTRYEGIPNSVLEAMAMGLPVVATDVGSIREVMDHNGELVGSDDPAVFARALRRILFDGKRRAKYAENSRRLARRFDLRFTSARLEELIIEALADKRGSTTNASSTSEAAFT